MPTPVPATPSAIRARRGCSPPTLCVPSIQPGPKIAASAADVSDAPPRDERTTPPNPALRPADADIVTAVLAHALRFGLDGKPRRTASDFLAPIAAEQIYQHMRRAGLVVFQRPATRPHPGMG